MDISSPQAEDIRNFMAQYYPELYKQTKYGFIHLLQLNTRKYIRKMLDKQGLDARKNILRNLNNTMKLIIQGVQERLGTTDGTWIIKGWDGNSLDDPRFLVFAKILADADTENNTSLEQARDFFNDVRNAITASNDQTTPRQAIRLARIWIENLKDEIIGLDWKPTQRKHKIRKTTKPKRNSSVADPQIIPVTNLSDTISVLQ